MKRFPINSDVLILIGAAIMGGCAKNPDATTNAGAEVAFQPHMVSLIIPDGTTLVASLDALFATDVHRTGDLFSATTPEALAAAGRTVSPAGAKIRGLPRDLRTSGRVSGRARLTLAYEALVGLEGESRAISARPLSVQAASTAEGEVEKIAAGTALGAIGGGIACRGRGAAIGAGAGAGAGTILVFATKGDDFRLNAGQNLRVYLIGPTSVSVLAQR